MATWNRVKVNIRPVTYAALRTICNASGTTLDQLLKEMIFLWVEARNRPKTDDQQVSQ